MQKPKTFKQCSSCKKSWQERKWFLSDPCIEIIGYMADFSKLELGIMLFNHTGNNCNTTIGIEAKEFRDLYNGEIFRQRNTGLEGCPGYCLNRNELRPCPAKCECAYIREIIQVIKTWPKQTSKTEKQQSFLKF